MSGSRQQIADMAADVLSGIVDGIVVADADRLVVIWNRAAEEMTGINASDAVSRRLDEVFSENPSVINQIEKTFETGRSYADYDALLAVKYRPGLPVGLMSTVLEDSEGMPVAVILTIRDQTGVQELKERIRRSDRLAAIGKIAAGIAHEIKNPLVGIRGAAQLLKSELLQGEDIPRESCRGLIEYSDVILKEADRLNGVLEGILDFTRVKPREMKGFNIHSVLDRALILNEETARKSGITLSRQYDPSLPEAFGNQDQLIQVFLNIIRNACEAMQGGGVLAVVTRISDLFTSVQADGRKHRLMVVKVSDTGAGIKEEHLNEIFTPFFTTKDRGVGLGLALSYQIVQEHLGTIRVESREGEGTTFSVYLPLAG